MPAPTVTSISPSSGLTTGGTSVTITGTNFSGVTGVTFGGAAVSSFTVNSSTSITCTTPTGSAGAASIVVTTSGGGPSAAASLFTYVPPPPTVASISPASGPTAGSTPVTITGTYFAGATGVSIGGTAATSVIVGGGTGGTQITCTTPAGIAGTASVLVTTAGGTNAANSLYRYAAVPTVTSISVSRGSTSGGNVVILTGTNFTGASGVTIGGTGASLVSVDSDTQITCTTPAHSAGNASVLVTTPGGTSATNSLFTFVLPPTVSSISATSGTANGGTSVTISGANFANATSVTIGGTAATGVSVASDGNSLTCTTPPAGSAGAASVLVTTPGGTNAANGLYTYLLTPPTVTSISPTSGVNAGGTTLTITGTNFSGTTGVTIGGVAATNFSVANGTTITCTTPAGSLGAASVQVNGPSHSNAANNLFTYTPPAPAITAVSPNTGSTLGGTPVTISGSNFIRVVSVTFGGVPATNVTTVSDGSITCIAPAGSADAAPVVVSTASASSAANSYAVFTYGLAVPTLAAITHSAPYLPISPNIGSSAGGTSVTITGANFTGTTGVTFGGAAATRVIVVDDNTLTCITPEGSTGATSVVVTTPNGSNPANGSGTSNIVFTYVVALPTVSLVSPPIGAAAGGTSVTLTGTYFTGATRVTFGGIAATGVTVVSNTSITCTTPAGIAGTASVQVTAGAGTSSPNSLYLYVAATPTDTFIYLKGGRGDGFVPLWTGLVSEEGMVNDTGTSLGTTGLEVSDPYRDIFTSTALNQTTGVEYGGFAAWPTPGPGTGTNYYPDEGSSSAYSAKGRLSDEVLHVKPRQFARVSTWLIFTSQSGLSYKFRKDQILGWGSQPRSA